MSGPNRVAADIQGNGEFNFLGFGGHHDLQTDSEVTDEYEQCCTNASLRQVQRLLVVVGRLLELAEEDVRVAQIAVRPPLGRAVAELACDLQNRLYPLEI